MLDRYKEVISGLLLLYLVAMPTAGVIKGELEAAGFFAGIGIAALLMLRLPDLVEFKAFGLEAKLRESIREAEATIDQLRELAATLAGPALDDLAMHGQTFTHLTFEHRCSQKERIVTTLRSIGLAETKIEEVADLWTSVARFFVAAEMNARVHKRNPQLARELRKVIGKRDDLSPPAQIKAFLDAHEIEADVLEIFDDYDRLWRTGELRHPERISSNFALMDPDE